MSLAILLGSGGQFPLRAGVVTDCSSEADLLAQIEAGGLVTFGCSGEATIALSAPIEITGSVVIDATGQSITLSPDGENRIFNVATNASLTVINVDLVGGVDRTGGGGAIFNRGSVYLRSCRLADNEAIGASGTDGRDSANGGRDGGDGGNGGHGRRTAGGAVFNLGWFTAVECVFEGNRAVGGSGGSGGNAHDGELRGGDGGDGGSGGGAIGGAIYSGHRAGRGRLELHQCEFEGNSAEGGEAAEGGTLGDGTFPGVDGRGGKGGLAAGGAVFSTNKTDATIVGCTFVANTVISGHSAAGGSSKNSGKPGPDGPGAFGGAICNHGIARVVNSTFSDNEIQAGNGGDGDRAAIKAGNGGNGGSAWGGSYYNAGTTYMTNCTLNGGIARPGTNGLAGTGAFSGRNGNRGTTRGANLSGAKGKIILGHTILENPASSTSAFTNTVITLTTNMTFNIDVDGTNTADLMICERVITLRFDGSVVRDVLACDTTEITGTNLVASTNTVFSTNINRNTLTDNRSNAYGAIKDAGYNLLSDLSIKFKRTSTSRTGLSAELGDLAENGGPTRTMEPGIEAIDRGTTNQPPVRTDQRGALRPAGDAVDIGALEVDGQIYDPAEITTQPLDYVTDPGQSAFFLVTADGSRPLEYHWYRAPRTAIPAATGPVLTLPQVQLSDEGGYYVVVSNISSTATSRVATLTLNRAPQILDPSEPRDVNRESGLALTLSFPTSGNGAYQWYFNGAPVVGATSSTLAIPSLLPSDSGSYRAVVTNGAGSVTSRVATVTVFTRLPVVVAEPGDASGYSGRPFTLSFLTTNAGVYRWTFNGQPLANATSSNVVFSSLHLTNNGTYQAIVTNFAGSVTSRIATISVIDSAPIILSGPPASTNMVLNGTLTLSATVEGSLPLTYQWYFSQSLQSVPIPGATGPVLQVNGFQAADSGTYTLQIVNPFGEEFTEPCEVLLQ